MTTTNAPNPALSYATVRGDGVYVQLQLQHRAPIHAGDVAVELTRRGAAVAAPATVSFGETSDLVSAELPLSDRSAGVWSVRLVAQDGARHDVPAFVLFPKSGPVALLPGRPATAKGIRPGRPGAGRAVLRLGAAGLDTALAVLPPARAATVRAAARRVATRLLG